ncbi:MAG TPA: NAD(P)H-binding protein [Solirubrobacteraceae bacterium]|nr:NAD(P)H-binding protein [Solirubrobacteraceae bacterium]
MTGATGFVGRRLADALAADGVAVRCLVRNRARAGHLRHELHEGDALDEASLRGAGRGVSVAYYLIHAMGRGGDPEFAARERRAARNFARMARAEGVDRVVYLGGLGEPRSRHLRSRHETALALAAEGPPLTYFRAAMVVGARSESFLTLYHLVRRLPVMVAPAWLRTLSQPIGIDDVVAYLSAAPREEPGEVQIGGPEVLSYGAMLDTVAGELGRREPVRIPVPLLTPKLSSLWIGLVTPVDAGVARPLIEGLSTETVVTEPVAARRFGVEPQPFAATVQAALRELAA